VVEGGVAFVLKTSAVGLCRPKDEASEKKGEAEVWGELGESLPGHTGHKGGMGE